MLDWLRGAHESSTWTTSVCTGALVLGAAGILDGKRATTHWAYLDRLEQLGAEPVSERVVEDGKVITAAGVSAGIDMALQLAARIAGDAGGAGDPARDRVRPACLRSTRAPRPRRRRRRSSWSEADRASRGLGQSPHPEPGEARAAPTSSRPATCDRPQLPVARQSPQLGLAAPGGACRSAPPARAWRSGRSAPPPPSAPGGRPRRPSRRPPAPPRGRPRTAAAPRRRARSRPRPRRRADGKLSRSRPSVCVDRARPSAPPRAGCAPRPDRPRTPR